MTSQGSAYGRFQRAMRRGQLFHAELATRELGHLSLAALALALLIADEPAARTPVEAMRAPLRYRRRFSPPGRESASVLSNAEGPPEGGPSRLLRVEPYLINVKTAACATCPPAALIVSVAWWKPSTAPFAADIVTVKVADAPGARSAPDGLTEYPTLESPAPTAAV